MTDATLIADMVRAGVDAELVGRVALLMSTVTPVTHASRDASRHVMVLSQTPGAIRARRARAKRKQNQREAKANDVASAGADGRDGERYASRDGVTEHCDLSSTSSSVKRLVEEGSKEKKKEAVTKCARGTRLVAGAQISPADFQFALGEGMPRERVPAEWAEFIDYWIAIPGQRGTKLNWSATWRNRVRALTAKGGRNGQRNRAHNSGESAVIAGLARAFGDRDGGSSGSADAEIPRGRFEFDGEPTRRS